MGFQHLKKEDRKKVASSGGHRAWQLGVAHKWDSKTAQKAGRLGGRAKKVIQKDIDIDLV